MTPLYTPEQFFNKKSREKLSLECEHCKNSFDISKNEIQKYEARVSNGVTPRNQLKFCSRNCYKLSKMSGKTINCVQCHCEFYRQLHEINPTNNFCSYSCAAVYANSHKTHGNRRSKLEIWIEHELKKLYPCLEFQFNKTAAINAELDIYVPSLNLAFELNGIFHYEPIFSEEKLNDVQNNDRRKFQLCLDKKIELCVINTSDQNRFSPKTSGIYLSIIKTIINEKMGWLTNPDIATQVSQT